MMSRLSASQFTEWSIKLLMEIWINSNKSKEEIVIGRRNAGYVSEEVDEYAL